MKDGSSKPADLAVLATGYYPPTHDIPRYYGQLLPIASVRCGMFIPRHRKSTICGCAPANRALVHGRLILAVSNLFEISRAPDPRCRIGSAHQDRARGLEDFIVRRLHIENVAFARFDRLNTRFEGGHQILDIPHRLTGRHAIGARLCRNIDPRIL